MAAAAYIAVIAAVYVIMPGLNEVPPAFPATTLWRFRIASLATQFTLWAAMGLIDGALTERRSAHRRPVTREALG